MKTNSPVFSPDSRNLGGRGQITEMIFNHHMTLLNVKSVVAGFCRPSSSSSSRKPKRTGESPQNQEKLLEVIESLKRAKMIKKGLTDTSKPKTFELTKMIQGRNKKEEEHQMQEHYLNLISQRKRMSAIETKPMNERKKNYYDHKAYPTLLFRRKTELRSYERSPQSNIVKSGQSFSIEKRPDSVSMSQVPDNIFQKTQFLKEKLDLENLKFIDSRKTLEKDKNKRQIGSKGKENAQKFIARSEEDPKSLLEAEMSRLNRMHQKDLLIDEVDGKLRELVGINFAKTVIKNKTKGPNYSKNDWMRPRSSQLASNTTKTFLLKGVRVPIPESRGTEDMDYENIKASLVNTIIKYKIFQNRDIDLLFEKTILTNKHLDRNRLLLIFSFIKQEMDKD